MKLPKSLQSLSNLFAPTQLCLPLHYLAVLPHCESLRLLYLLCLQLRYAFESESGHMCLLKSFFISTTPLTLELFDKMTDFFFIFKGSILVKTAASVFPLSSLSPTLWFHSFLRSPCSPSWAGCMGFVLLGLPCKHSKGSVFSIISSRPGPAILLSIFLNHVGLGSWQH